MWTGVSSEHDREINRMIMLLIEFEPNLIKMDEFTK